MRLIIEPAPSLGILSKDVDLVIEVEESELPETYVDLGQPRPDRHLVLGLVQCAAIAIEEQDVESTLFTTDCSITLVRENDPVPLRGPLIVARSADGNFGVIAIGDETTARRLMRRAIRHFSGTIRMDLP
jgi:hypothetical protein